MRTGGRIVYVTCSVLPEENEGRAELLARFEGYRSSRARTCLRGAGLAPFTDALLFTSYGLQMTPLRTGTDGFFVAVIERRG